MVIGHPDPQERRSRRRKLFHQWFPIDRGLQTPLPINASQGGEITIGSKL